MVALRVVENEKQLGIRIAGVAEDWAVVELGIAEILLLQLPKTDGDRRGVCTSGC